MPTDSHPSSLSQTPPPGAGAGAWWRSRSVLLALLAHAVLFLGLFQLHYPEAERGRLSAISKAHPEYGGGTPVMFREHGILGLVTDYFDCPSELRLYHRYSELALHGIDMKRPADDPAQGGLRPYRDVLVEYPPGALLVMIIPGLFTSDFDLYVHLYVAWAGMLCLGAMLWGFRLLSDGPLKPEGLARMLWWSVLFIALFGPILAARLDFAVPLICVLGAAVFHRAWRTNSRLGYAAFGVVVACGVMVKIVPGVLLPAALLCLLAYGGRPRWKEAFIVSIGFVAALLALNAIFYGLWGEGFLRCYTYHVDRGIQIETTYSGLLAALQGAGHPLSVGSSFGSCNLVTPYTELVKKVSPLLFLLAAAIIALRFLSRRLSGPVASPTFALLLLSVLFLLAFMLTGKVFSPQFLLWVSPLMALMKGLRRDTDRILTVFLVAGGLTQLVYPLFYDSLCDLHPAMIGLLNFRNVLLIGILFCLILRLPSLLQTEPGQSGGRSD